MIKELIITFTLLCTFLNFSSALNIPYQGSLELNGQHICGVTIISFSAFLTAAHCVQGKNPKKFSVRAGTITRGVGGQVVGIKEFRIHPNFNNKTLDYDLAIIIPKRPLPDYGYITEFIEEIRIAEGNKDLEGKIAVTSGWGYDENDNFAETLMFVDIPILNRDVCKKYVKMTDQMICGGYLEGGKGTCHGDAGGPLVLKDKLIGIISNDNGCGKPNTPDLFTDVRVMKPWIKKIVFLSDIYFKNVGIRA